MRFVSGCISVYSHGLLQGDFTHEREVYKDVLLAQRVPTKKQLDCTIQDPVCSLEGAIIIVDGTIAPFIPHFSPT